MYPFRSEYSTNNLYGRIEKIKNNSSTNDTPDCSDLYISFMEIIMNWNLNQVILGVRKLFYCPTYKFDNVATKKKRKFWRGESKSTSPEGIQ